MDETRVSPDELAALLQIDQPRVEQLVSEGLPWRSGGRRKRFKWSACWFNEDEAAEWLIEQGYIAQPRLVSTLGEVAAHFGVTSRSIQYWREQGAPISDDGYYDLDLIAAWREARLGKDGGAADQTRAEHETNLSRIKAEKAQLELDELRGKLVDVEICKRVIGRHLTELKSHLEGIAEFQASLLPPNTPAAVVTRVKTETTRKFEDILNAQAEVMQDLANEIEAETVSSTKKRKASRTLRTP